MRRVISAVIIAVFFSANIVHASTGIGWFGNLVSDPNPLHKPAVVKK